MALDTDSEPNERESASGPRAMSRVLRLLDCLAKAPEGLSLTDLSSELSTPKSTMLNSLRPLAAEGFLVAEGSLYRLGPKAFRLAADISSAWSLPRILRGYLRQVWEATHESVALAVLDVEMRRFVYIDAIESPQPVRYATRIGMSGALYATAAGRVLLAHQPQEYQEAYLKTAKLVAITPRTNTDARLLRRQLEEVRQTGVWLSAGESVPGSAAVAAPVFGPEGQVLAAVSLGAGLQKKGDAIQAVGRSRGGRTSKIHALADDLGRPVAFTLTPGNIADISVARDLLETLAPPQRLLADKAYDADSLRDWLKARRVQAVIPSNATRRTPYPLDKTAYKRRNLIERMFCRLKDWRRIATRYDRTARNFLSALALAATISFWAK